MSTKLSTRLAKMSVEEIAHEYALGFILDNDQPDTMTPDKLYRASIRWYLKEEMVRRIGHDRTNELVSQTEATLAIFGLSLINPT